MKKERYDSNEDHTPRFLLTRRGKTVLAAATTVVTSAVLGVGAYKTADYFDPSDQVVGECAVGEVQPGMGGISAVEDALGKMDATNIKDQDIVYGGQQAGRLFAVDGEVKPGEAAKVCISKVGSDIVSVTLPK